MRARRRVAMLRYSTLEMKIVAILIVVVFLAFCQNSQDNYLLKVYEGELGVIQNFAFIEELGRSKISKKNE
jgi:hypothetical protein